MVIVYPKTRNIDPNMSSSLVFHPSQQPITELRDNSDRKQFEIVKNYIDNHV